jgi:hypothetical protein
MKNKSSSFYLKEFIWVLETLSTIMGISSRTVPQSIYTSLACLTSYMSIEMIVLFDWDRAFRLLSFEELAGGRCQWEFWRGGSKRNSRGVRGMREIGKIWGERREICEWDGKPRNKDREKITQERMRRKELSKKASRGKVDPAFYVIEFNNHASIA